LSHIGLALTCSCTPLLLWSALHSHMCRLSRAHCHARRITIRS
jgi:hypothetical protein